jgi:ElaB/YqjD/DUF883 family membrane-anchored ribosome-binding protein
MATEKTPARSKAAVAEAPTLVDDVPGDDQAQPSPAEAIHELGGTLGRAWSEARDSVSDIGAKLGQRARNVRAETREAASETREGFQEAIDDMGELGQEIAEDAMELGRSIGLSVSEFVRRHPMRSIAIAAVTGAIAARLLRRRGR